MSGTTAIQRLSLPFRSGNRFAYLALGVGLFIAAIVGVALWGRSATSPSTLAGIPSISPLPGDKTMDPRLQALAREDARRRVEEVERQQGSYITSLATADTTKITPSTPPATPQTQGATQPQQLTYTANPIPVQGRQTIVTQRTEEPGQADPRYAVLFATLIAGMAPHGSALAIEESPEMLKQRSEDHAKLAETRANFHGPGGQTTAETLGGHAGAGMGHVLMSAGHWSMGTTVLATNTDANGPVVVRMIDGPLKGARLIGSAQKAGDKMGVSLTRMERKGLPSIAIDAILISPETKESTVASRVEHHYGERLLYPSLAAVASGVGQAVALSGSTQVSSAYGNSSSYRNFNPEQIAAIGLGAAGNNLQRELQEMAPRGSTAYLDAEVAVGVLFLKDVVDSAQ